MATNPFMAGPGTTQASDYFQDTAGLSQKEALIKMLMGQQQPQGRMVGQSYVAPTPLETLVKGLQPILGMHMNKGLTADKAAAAQRFQTGMQEELMKMSTPGADGTIPREQIVKMLASQYPEVRQFGTTELGKLNAQDTPFMRMLKPLLGGAGGQQVPGGGGGLPMPGEGGVGPSAGEPMPGNLGGVPSIPAPGAPQAQSPASGGLQAMFPNLTMPEILLHMQSDPSGKSLAEANQKRNDPRVVGDALLAPMGGGQFGNAPGSVQARAAQTGAVEAAKAPFGTPIRIDTGDAEYTMRPDQFQAAAGGNGGQFRLPAAGGRPSTGLPGVPAGIGSAQKQERAGLFDADVKQLNEYRTNAEKSSQGMKAINQIERGLKGGSFQGAYANIQERAAALFGPLGIPVDTNKLTNTQEVKAFVQNLVIPQVKQLGFNPTDADARRIEESVGNIKNDPKALENIMSVLKQNNQTNIDLFKRADLHLRKNRTLEGFEYGFGESAPATAPKRVKWSDLP